MSKLLTGTVYIYVCEGMTVFVCVCVCVSVLGCIFVKKAGFIPKTSD